MGHRYRQKNRSRFRFSRTNPKNIAPTRRPWWNVLFTVRFASAGPTVCWSDTQPAFAAAAIAASLVLANAGSRASDNERPSSERGSRMPARSSVNTLPTRTIARIPYFRWSRRVSWWLGTCHRVILKRNEKNWSTAPNGHTHPHRYRPKSTVTTTETSASTKAVRNDREAMSAARPRSGSKWKNRSTGPITSFPEMRVCSSR